jgi:hypothetical protein
VQQPAPNTVAVGVMALRCFVVRDVRVRVLVVDNHAELARDIAEGSVIAADLACDASAALQKGWCTAAT